jgi:C4-dicarboxylate-specific signal transduction histidine kinase
MDSEQAGILNEVKELTKNIDHIKEIVAMQQSYARVAGVMEVQSIPALVEDALRMHATALDRDHVRVVRQFDPIPDVLTDKHKVLQILVNLISNAKYALSNSTATERLLTIGARMNGTGTVLVSVADNGIGIGPENLTRIFTHGFTTRKDGHGFGLHGGHLAAREMGGTLSAHSDGAGKGATFTLELPIKSGIESTGSHRNL